MHQLQPQSILDIGVGYAKWGHLFREYTDINAAAEKDHHRYNREHWQVRIDGIEGFEKYITDMHRYLYNHIYIGDMCELIKTLPKYDMIFLGDVIEHIDKETGFKVIRDCIEHANKAVVLSTPTAEIDQSDICGNEFERHRSAWSIKDFKTFDRTIIRDIDRAAFLVVIVKPGINPPICKPQRYFPERPMGRIERWYRKVLVLCLGWKNFQKLELKKRWRGR